MMIIIITELVLFFNTIFLSKRIKVVTCHKYPLLVIILFSHTLKKKQVVFFTYFHFNFTFRTHHHQHHYQPAFISQLLARYFSLILLLVDTLCCRLRRQRTDVEIRIIIMIIIIIMHTKQERNKRNEQKSLWRWNWCDGGARSKINNFHDHLLHLL